MPRPNLRFFLCVLDPRDFPVFMKESGARTGGQRRSAALYRYLNCGFPLTATAGTDKMTTFVTVGANRLFAHVQAFPVA